MQNSFPSSMRAIWLLWNTIFILVREFSTLTTFQDKPFVYKLVLVFCLSLFWPCGFLCIHHLSIKYSQFSYSFNVHIVPALTNGSPFESVPKSFWHDPIRLWKQGICFFKGSKISFGEQGQVFISHSTKKASVLQESAVRAE